MERSERRIKNKKILKNHELTNWLKNHNSSVLDNISRISLEERYDSEIKASLLSDNLSGDFSFNDEILKLNSPSCNEIDQILKLNYNKVRYSSGMNLSTLLAENKRNIILKAIIQNDCHAAPLDMVETANSVTSVSENRNMNSRNNLSKCDVESMCKTSIKPLNYIRNNTAEFSPNLDHYSVMQSRWSDIRLTVKNLTNDGVMNEKKHNQLTSSIHHHNTSEQRRKQISNRTNRIILEKIKMENKKPVLMHAVRY
jgi:hypothetical protein